MRKTDFYSKDELINHYANHYLSEANIEKLAKYLNQLTQDVTLVDDYISKIKNLLLNINSDKIEQALLIYDLKKEMGLKMSFSKKKFLNLSDLKTKDNEVSDEKFIRFSSISSSSR